jgi:hypothetical protein
MNENMNETLSEKKLRLLRNYIVHMRSQDMEAFHRYVGDFDQLPPHVALTRLKGSFDMLLKLEGQRHVLEMKTLARWRRSNPIRDRLEEGLRQNRERQEKQWFDYVICCVPKQIREPWLGDLREDRERMAKDGQNYLRIEFATALQCLFMVGAVLWNFVRKG